MSVWASLPNAGRFGVPAAVAVLVVVDGASFELAGPDEPQPAAISAPSISTTAERRRGAEVMDSPIRVGRRRHPTRRRIGEHRSDACGAVRAETEFDRWPLRQVNTGSQTGGELCS